MESKTNEFWSTLGAIGLGLIGVASLALVLSRNSTTVPLTSAVATGFATDLAVALSPVTGSSGGNLNTGFSAQGFGEPGY